MREGEAAVCRTPRPAVTSSGQGATARGWLVPAHGRRGAAPYGHRRYLMDPAVSPDTTFRSISAKRTMTGIVAITEPANRLCQSTWYWPM